MQRSQTALSAIGAMLCSVWLGGLVVLGAIVAPTVFRNVPDGRVAADAMTLVFQRFDRLALGCCGALVVVELARAVLGKRKLARLDLARIGLTLAAAGMALYEGLVISPRIAALHREGAVRGLGEAGLELAAVHTRAETLGKVTVVVAAILVALHVWSGRNTAAPRVDDPPPAQ
jgi:hypothetical protein